MHTCAHTRTLTTAPRGDLGDSCPPGLDLVPRRPCSAHRGTHHLLFLPSVDTERERERGSQSPRVSPGRPHSPTIAEGMGSLAAPHTAPCPAAPLRGVPCWDPGTRSTQVGSEHRPSPPGGPAPGAEAYLPAARQPPRWDLSVHLPLGPLLRKWEGVEEVLQRGAPGSEPWGKCTQEEGQVDSRATFRGGDTVPLPWS